MIYRTLGIGIGMVLAIAAGTAVADESSMQKPMAPAQSAQPMEKKMPPMQKEMQPADAKQQSAPMAPMPMDGAKKSMDGEKGAH